MSVNPHVTQALESLTDSLPALQNNLQKFLAEYEDKVVQARVQIAHIEALLGSFPTEAPHAKAKSRGASRSTTPNPQKTKRQSLFGSDKEKIIIGKKFDEPLTEFQDFDP